MGVMTPDGGFNWFLALSSTISGLTIRAFALFPPESIADATKVIALKPKSADAYFRKGYEPFSPSQKQFLYLTRQFLYLNLFPAYCGLICVLTCLFVIV